VRLFRLFGKPVERNSLVSLLLRGIGMFFKAQDSDGTFLRAICPKHAPRSSLSVFKVALPYLEPVFFAQVINLVRFQSGMARVDA
jgi:hypothetical protein